MSRNVTRADGALTRLANMSGRIRVELAIAEAHESRVRIIGAEPRPVELFIQSDGVLASR